MSSISQLTIENLVVLVYGSCIKICNLTLPTYTWEDSHYYEFKCIHGHSSTHN